MTSGTGPTAERFVNYDTGQPQALRDTTNSTFVAAGTNHRKGLVPDPGSTAHSPAWLLGDDSVFHNITAAGLGALLAANNLSDLASTTTAAQNLGVINSVNIQSFSSSGTYTPSANTIFIVMECVGGGGAGGGVVGGTTDNIGGGGGGGGAYSRAVATISQVGASQTITIGAGGVGLSGSTGGGGGTTSVGTLITALGGNGGSVNSPNSSFGSPGAGGSAGSLGGGISGTTLAGWPGFYGSLSFTSLPSATGLIAQGGQGGNSYFGAGGYGSIAGSGSAAGNGAAAAGFGGGGQGACVSGNASNGTGGNGFKGFVLITEFIS